ncbi:MAG: hypothetical protein ACOCRX_05950 [Candidatus Woesearchaeota archaeon]
MNKKIKWQENTKYWEKSLKNVPCFLLGNGPSISNQDLSILKDYFTIGINRIFKKIDPTILFWQDLSTWLEHKNEIKKTKAIKLCRKGAETENYCYHFLLKRKNHVLTSSLKYLYGRGNTSALAFQVAYALGCNPIFLIGIDCKYAKNGDTNFPVISFSNSCSNDDVFLEKISIKTAAKIAGKENKKNREFYIKKIFQKYKSD